MAYIGTPAAPVATVVGDNAVTTRSIAPNAVTPPKLANSGSELSFRNRIINGDMRIDQRNAGASVTLNSTTPQYPVDRIVCGGWASAGVFTAQQSTTATAGFVNSLVCTVTTTSALSTSGEEYVVRQNIEGLNVADLRWGTANASAVTISFWVRSSLTGTFAGSITNNAYDRSYVFTYTISSANTYEYKTVTIPGDTTGTWLANNSTGLRLQFNLGAGSSKTVSPGSWGAGYFQNATGSVQLIGTNGATFYITGVQLEAGTVATPFERRDYGRELIMCQRYYYKFNGGLAACAGAVLANTNLRGFVQLPVQMRASPTGSTNITGAGTGANQAAMFINGYPTITSFVFSVDLLTAQTLSFNMSTASGYSAGAAGSWDFGSGSFVAASAEL